MSTYTPVASQTLGSAAASVTFSSIPQGYTDLVIVVAGTVNTGSYFTLRFNNDTASNYSNTEIDGNGTAAASNRNTSNSYMYNGSIMTTQSNVISHIQNYSNSTTFKTVLTRSNYTSAGVKASVGLWRNTSAITSIEIGTGGANTYQSGSTFSLYGIAGGGFTAKAAGGVVTTDATYAYHTFLSSGAFTPYEALTVDYLVVAGGGGSTRRNANAGGTGGGGAGGMRCTVTASGGSPGTVETALSVSANYAYPVIVGAGGAAGTATEYVQGFNGSDSVFASITSVGGGGGGGTRSNSSPGSIGGSGGGAGWDGTGTDVGGSGTANQGFAGGQVNSAIDTAGAGGGGASAVGANASGTNGSNGGTGRATSITGSSVTYAGGGAGGTYGGAAGTGGAGGGGNSSTAGTANTGGGAGGASGTTAASNGTAGGSGIVIIRYAL